MAADVKIYLTDWLASNDRMTNRPDIHSDIKYQGREWQGWGPVWLYADWLIEGHTDLLTTKTSVCDW